jgi:hypothetical protein
MNNLTTGVLAALLLASPIAGAETEYPASDFKPKVLYKDAEYKHTQSSASSASAEKSKPAAAETTKPDAKYPAATFKPEVVYKDAEYKHTQSAPSAPASKSASTEESGSTGAVATTEKKEEQSMTNYLVGLGAFALAGLFFFGRKPKEQVEKAAPVYSRDASGLTGVARYLNEQEAASATGVAKYLNKQAASEEPAATATASATGVAKYLDKKSEADATGVEKYLRKQG